MVTGLPSSSPDGAARSQDAREPQVSPSQRDPTLFPPALPVVSLAWLGSQAWEGNNGIGEDPTPKLGARMGFLPQLCPNSLWVSGQVPSLPGSLFPPLSSESTGLRWRPE